MTSAILGAAARYAIPMVASMGAQYIGGKQAENIGNYNEQQSAQDRLKSQLLNEDPNKQGDRQADVSNRAAIDQQGRSRGDTIFDNQLKQSNNRADLQNQMMANDQTIAYNRGSQLADNYVQSARDQATASGNILNSIMSAPVARYGTITSR